MAYFIDFDSVAKVQEEFVQDYIELVATTMKVYNARGSHNKMPTMLSDTVVVAIW